MDVVEGQLNWLKEPITNPRVNLSLFILASTQTAVKTTLLIFASTQTAVKTTLKKNNKYQKEMKNTVMQTTQILIVPQKH